ncbi:MAG: SDR family oxidoreductase, partial [Clostridia bacterium]|nr:SDR family oxidoreductase [Clostridia bacterium]
MSCSFSKASAVDAAAALAEETGAKALPCDVTDEDQVRAALESVGPIDGLVLCAGVAHYGLIQMMSDADWQRLFDVNVTGMFRVIRAALPNLLRQQHGSIV